MSIPLRFEAPLNVCLGDSISDYQYFSTNMYPGHLASFLPCTVGYAGVAGDSTSGIIANRLTPQGVKEYDFLVGVNDPGAQYWVGQNCFVLIGINDILFGQPTAAALWSNLQIIYSTISTNYGMTVRPITLLPFGSYSPNTINFSNFSATGGTFTITYGTHTTTNISATATAAQVASAVAALSGIGTGNAVGTGGPLPGNVVVTMSVSVSSAFTVDRTNLTGGGFTFEVGWTAFSESVRTTVNSNIRSSGLPYIDMEAMGTGGAQTAMIPAYVGSDNLHPSLQGGMQMAAIIANDFSTI